MLDSAWYEFFVIYLFILTWPQFFFQGRNAATGKYISRALPYPMVLRCVLNEVNAVDQSLCILSSFLTIFSTLGASLQNALGICFSHAKPLRGR